MTEKNLTASEPGNKPITTDDIWGFMDDLRMIAKSLLQNESDACSIRPTALVLSALKRNRPADKEWDEVTWANQRYFFKVMHTHMVWYLRDRARYWSAKCRQKAVPVDPSDIDFFDLKTTIDENPEYVVALDEALTWLRREHPKLAQLVQHRYFTGLTTEETGALLGVSMTTIKRRWREAKVLLYEKVIEYLNSDCGE